MHGNTEPRLSIDAGQADRTGQADRINPIHLKLQYGDLGDPDHLWDTDVPVQNRRQELADIKIAAAGNGFAAELFQHCAAARKCIPVAGRKIEPRPASVVAATEKLMLRQPSTPPTIAQCLERFVLDTWPPSPKGTVLTVLPCLEIKKTS